MPALTDLLLPRFCPCGDPKGPACDSCLLGLAGAGARLVMPYPVPAGLPACAAAAPYRDRVRRLLIAYKERGRRDLAPPLSLALAQAVLALPVVRSAAAQAAVRSVAAKSPIRLLLIPVPASRAAWRARGVDHVATLVLGALVPLRRLIGPGLLRVSWSPSLQVTRRVADQVGLGAAARATNLRGALRVREADRFQPGSSLAGASTIVILIDDVLTTGATMAEAARALAAGGVRAKGAAVVATAVRHEAARGQPLFPQG